MSDYRGDDWQKNVQERGRVLDWRENEELDGGIMSIFEYIGLTLISLGICMFVFIGITCAVFKLMEYWSS